MKEISFRKAFFSQNALDLDKYLKFRFQVIIILMTMGLISLYCLVSQVVYQLREIRFYHTRKWAEEIISSVNEQSEKWIVRGQLKQQSGPPAVKINQEAFLKDVRRFFFRSGIKNRTALQVNYQGNPLELIRKLKVKGRKAGEEYLEDKSPYLKRVLKKPLNDFEFQFIILPKSGWVYHYWESFLELVLGAVVPFSLLGMYWIAMNQAKLSKERNNFVSAVSHELKTPLTTIRMYSEILKKDLIRDQSKIKTYYDFIIRECDRLSRLILNILDVARLGTNTAIINLASYSPGELLKMVVARVELQIAGAGFVLEKVEDKNGSARADVFTDSDAFIQIMINLVDNALKFAKNSEDRRIILGYRCKEDKTVFFVRDFGPGVSRQDSQKIFQAFYRGGDELTRTAVGTGIGLTLVKELAKQLGAQVRFENKDPGCEFILECS